MPRYVALLRGINVGGRTSVKMADLRAMFAEMGLREVQTLLQSGNVVFEYEDAPRPELEERLATSAERSFGRRIEFFVRTADEWDAVVAGNPFPTEAERDPAHLLAVMGKVAPTPEAVATVAAANPGAEVLRVVGDCLYVHFPDDIGHSKLIRTPGWRKLDAGSTSRNWNTVLKLAAMLRG